MFSTVLVIGAIVFWLAVLFIPPLRAILLGGLMLIAMAVTMWLVFLQDIAEGIIYKGASWLNSPFVTVPALCVGFAVLMWIFYHFWFPTIRIKTEE